jgi:hypothetical protein
MNAKKLLVAAVLGTIVTVGVTTQTATAAVWRRPVYRGPVYGAHWHRPYYYGGVTVPAPVVYETAVPVPEIVAPPVVVTAPAPVCTTGVYVAPRFGFRIR